MRKFNITNTDLTLVVLDKNNPDDFVFIESHSDTIFEILKSGYSNIGGCAIYRNVKHMLKNASRYKLVMDFNNDKIFACATYRYFDMQHSYKCILISENKEIDQPTHTTIKLIIKSDILNFKKLYWIEAGGPIAHWEEKYGAIKIPNTYIPAILKNNDGVILNPDGYTYTRNIAVPDNVIPVEKTMFGFADDEILNKIIRQDKIRETEQLLEQLIGTDESRSLYEAHELKYYSRAVTLLKIMELIEDRYYNNLLFHNITVKTKQLMERLISECKTIEVPKFIKNEFTQLQDEMDLILSCANVMKFHRLF